MSMQNETVVSVRNLVLSIREDGAADDTFRFLIEYGSFDIQQGDFVLIKGRNGCGKSTFLRLFHLQGNHYFKIVDGSIQFCAAGFPSTSIHQYSHDALTQLNCAVAWIGQEERFLSSDSAYSYIYNTCKIALNGTPSLTRGQKKDRLGQVDCLIRNYYEQYLASSFLCKNYKSFKTKNVRAWSGGQQKMIHVLAGIIKAQICGLQLLIMDEPLNNLDGRNKDILNKLLADLRRNQIAVIAITHCQIFNGVNKVLQITEGEDGVRRATLHTRPEPAHSECLENFS